MPTTHTASTEARSSRGVIVGLLAVLALALIGTSLFGSGPGGSGDEGIATAGPAAEALPADRHPAPTPLAASAPSGIDIPAIRVHTASLMDLGLSEDRALQVPHDARTIGWYAGGSTPGENGPAVFASHVNFDGVRGGFADLARMAPGQQIVVPRVDGITTVFVVDRVDRVSKQAFPTEQVYGPTARPEIRLITCGGAFDRATRSYLSNIVVSGHLTEAFRA